MMQPPCPLTLMPPAELPTEIALGAPEAAEIRALLQDFLAALERPTAADKAQALGAVLALCPENGAHPVPVLATGIPAKPAEVEDFDRYFGLKRDASAAPALTLVTGLVQTAAGIMALAARAPDLPMAALAQQQAGFAAHARLLARICKLELAP